jgi:hypothetical protein
MAGCGGGGSSSDDASAPEETAVRFAEAVGKGESSEACELQSAESNKEVKSLANEFAKTEGQVCEDLIRRLNLHLARFPEAKRTKVDGGKAEVEIEVSGGETSVVELVEEPNGEWKVEEVIGGS